MVDDPAAVAALDADDPERGTALTEALRRAFALRGMSGGSKTSLPELRLALGCDGDEPACLAGAGEMLSARRLIYGTMRASDAGGWALQIMILEVETATVAASARIALTPEDLQGARVDETATRIVDQLLGPQDSPPPPPPPEASSSQGDVEPVYPTTRRHSDAGPDRDGGWFGLERPTPPWKWAGFGTGLGVTVVFGAATLGMGVWLNSSNGGFRGDLLALAEQSLTDQNPLNDVDPSASQSVNLCEFAAESPTDSTGAPIGGPGQVRNATIAKACDDAGGTRRAMLATGIVTGVGALTTLVFTGLLLIHRGPRPKRLEAWRHRGLQVGLDPVGGGGAAVRLGGRF